MKYPKTFIAPGVTLLLGALVCPAGAALVTYEALDSLTGLTAGAPDTGSNDAFITASGAKFGSAASFDGAGDYFSVNAGGGVAGTGARTVSVWVNQTAATADLRSPVAFGANGNGTKFDLDIDGANVGLEVGVGAGRSTTSGIGFTSGTWQHLVVSVGAGQNVGSVLAYLNAGSAITSAANTRAINTTGTRMVIGTSANVGTVSLNPSIQFFNGLIDDVAVWDEALTAGEIKGLYDVGNSVGLAYTANVFDNLKQVHDAGSGSTTIGGLEWTYSTGLTGSAGLTSGTGGYTLILDAGSGTGLTAIPEPNIAILGSLSLLGLLRRRKR